jgi:hypothetical protein
MQKWDYRVIWWRPDEDGEAAGETLLEIEVVPKDDEIQNVIAGYRPLDTPHLVGRIGWEVVQFTVGLGAPVMLLIRRPAA